jgi:superfamily II DNA or RNA helicase
MTDDEKRAVGELREECARLRGENRKLRALLGMEDDKQLQDAAVQSDDAAVTVQSSQGEKISLFRNLFRGREDVYPVRWESRNGRTGYSPACVHEWNKKLCQKPRVKCGVCDNRELLPVNDEVIYDHLTGKHTIGVYPLLRDETCWLLAVDFDKSTFVQDAAALKETCRVFRIPVAIERSRSGNGIHAWFFFQNPITAELARKFGSTLITATTARRPEIGLESYDRLFPSQDTIPKGGFGSLIALPLQHDLREGGNSVFLNDNFHPFDDQWTFLASVEKIQRQAIQKIVSDAKKHASILGVRMSLIEDEVNKDPWIFPPSGKKELPHIEGPMPGSVLAVFSNMLFIEKESVPPALLDRIIRLAAFQNPDFYRSQAMRLSTYGKPRIIKCAEDFPRHIGLPRGSLRELRELLKDNNIELELQDERTSGTPIEATFRGTLRPKQQSAVEKILAHDIGVLSAATAFGKTVAASAVIAERGANTLVLVHRRQLMDQWRTRLSEFLGVPITGAGRKRKKHDGEEGENPSQHEIGQIGGGANQGTGFIDVAVMQSLYRKGVVSDLVAEYGQVIVDECHRVSAVSVESIMKQVKARYVLGLTATPFRKDGHHPIIMMQCGPIRYRATAKKEVQESPYEHVVNPRHTDFHLAAEEKDVSIQEIYSQLTRDENRNDMIFNDLLTSLEMKRSPLLLTERTEHVEYFAGRLEKFARNVIAMRGGLGKRQREEIAERIASIPDEEERVLVATGRYIGEGFDDARLDTLFLALPISWKGTLQQYAGRLHRLYDRKKIIMIYDYIDSNVPVLMRMYQKRLKGYRAMGYAVKPV